jgi:hypothetical protein
MHVGPWIPTSSLNVSLSMMLLVFWNNHHFIVVSKARLAHSHYPKGSDTSHWWLTLGPFPKTVCKQMVTICSKAWFYPTCFWVVGTSDVIFYFSKASSTYEIGWRLFSETVLGHLGRQSVSVWETTHYAFSELIIRILCCAGVRLKGAYQIPHVFC